MTHARRDLRRLAAATCLSALGDMLAMIALVLAVHELTGSAVAVSGLFAATLVPVVVASPLAGLLVDRVENVRLLVVASLAQAAVAAALVPAVGHLPALLALAALLAAGSAVSQPAEAALVPAIAGTEGLARASGTMETARYIGFAAGPVLAAGLSGLSGPELALAANAVTFLAIAAAAASLRTRRRPRGAAGERGSLTDAMAGARRIAGDSTLRVVVGAAVASLAVVSITLVAEVFYAKDVLRAGDGVYALLTAVWMAGMVVGASGIAPRVPAPWVAAAALGGLVVQGAGIAGQTALALVPVALAGYLVGGIGHGAKNTLIRTLVARRVPEQLHGRAFAAYGAARNVAELAAIGAGGALVGALGPRDALLLAGAAPIALGLLGLVALRQPSRITAVSAITTYTHSATPTPVSPRPNRSGAPASISDSYERQRTPA